MRSGVLCAGSRTFFHHGGANDLLVEEDVDLASSSARILHRGAPGLHPTMDAGRSRGLPARPRHVGRRAGAVRVPRSGRAVRDSPHDLRGRGRALFEALPRTAVSPG